MTLRLWGGEADGAQGAGAGEYWFGCWDRNYNDGAFYRIVVKIEEF